MNAKEEVRKTLDDPTESRRRTERIIREAEKAGGYRGEYDHLIDELVRVESIALRVAHQTGALS